MGFMNCNINSKEDNERLHTLVSELSNDDVRILTNAMNEHYQTGVDRTGVLVGGALIVASLFWHYVGNAIIKKKLNR